MRPHLRPLAIAALAVSLAVGACNDAPTGPGAVWVASETEAALQLRGELPTLPTLIERARTVGRAGDTPVGAGLDADYSRALGLWRAAEADTASRVRARTLRDRAYGIAADRLAVALDSSTLAAVHADLEGWIDAAGATGLPRDLPEVAGTVRQARAWLGRARSTLAHDREASIMATLRTADHLSDLTPPAVARRMIRHADALAANAPAGDDSPTARTLRRAERLLAGARDALDDGEPVRAIRRAYYAARLLEPR